MIIIIIHNFSYTQQICILEINEAYCKSKILLSRRPETRSESFDNEAFRIDWIEMRLTHVVQEDQLTGQFQLLCDGL